MQPRPRYENEYTLSTELVFAKELEAIWSCTLHKLPISYQIDFSACRNGEQIAWVEVKQRSNPHNKYQTYILSVLKWRELVRTSQVTNLPAILAVRFTNIDMYFTIPKNNQDVLLKYEVAGRTKNTRDAADIEPVVHIPIKLFKKVKS